MWNTLKRIKLLHRFYNLLNYKKLRYLDQLYKQLGLNKRFYNSISSIDFPLDAGADLPWLDRVDSSHVLSYHSAFSQLSSNYQEEILSWSKDGFAILRSFYSTEEVNIINDQISSLLMAKQLPIRDKRKIMNAVRYSAVIKNIVDNESLKNILNLLMGREVGLYQSVNFIKGSEDHVHSDFIHMTTYPYGYLIAVWVALEDTNDDNGPLYFYPCSHRLPYIMNRDFSHGSNKWLIGKSFKYNYTKKIESIIQENNFEKKVFIAKKGDVLIWHANMLHGGSHVKNAALTRKSMVLHYFGQNVIRYHEVTERPSLLLES